jgi:hypothetical protein
MQRHRLAWIVGAFLAGTALAWARPPEGVPLDPAMHEWYQSLKEPGTNYPCCSEADCRPAEYRMGANGYEALLDDKWVAVPAERCSSATAIRSAVRWSAARRQTGRSCALCPQARHEALTPSLHAGGAPHCTAHFPRGEKSWLLPASMSDKAPARA